MKKEDLWQAIILSSNVKVLLNFKEKLLMLFLIEIKWLWIDMKNVKKIELNIIAFQLNMVKIIGHIDNKR